MKLKYNLQMDDIKCFKNILLHIDLFTYFTKLEYIHKYTEKETILI